MQTRGSKAGNRSVGEKGTPGSSLGVTSFLLFLTLVLIYSLASLLPESFLWGVNQLAAVSTPVRLFLISGAILITIPAVSRILIEPFERFLRVAAERKKSVLIIAGIIGAIGSVVFYQNRIITDMYGDSRTLLNLLAGRHYSITDLFGFNDTEPLTRLIHQSLSRSLGLDQKLTIQIVSAITGGLFLIAVLLFVVHSKQPPIWKVFAGIILVSLGANQLFFGHVEDYTLVYLAIIVFLVLSWRLFEGRKTLMAMMGVFALGVGLHVEMLLLTPALTYAIFYSNRDRFPAIPRPLRPKTIIAALILTLACGLLAYMFYFKAYEFTSDNQNEIASKIFLPVKNPLPFPHAYSLLSLEHLSDVLQELLLTVAPGALLICILALVRFRELRWDDQRTIFFSIAAFYFLLFNLTVNPILSMPRDWDFLSLAAAPIAFLSLALSTHFFDGSTTRRTMNLLIACSLGMGILSSTVFFVNSHEDTASRRLRSIGIWVYRSYYRGSSYIINVGCKLIGTENNMEIEERRRIIQELEPFKSKHDSELGFLYEKLGQVYFMRGDYDNSARCFSKSIDVDAMNLHSVKELAVTCLKTRRFSLASDLIDVYNQQVNDPVVTEPTGLTLSEYINYIGVLESSGRDSLSIQKALDQVQLF